MRRQANSGTNVMKFRSWLSIILGLTLIVIIAGGLNISANASGRDILDKVKYNIESLQAKRYGTTEFRDIIKDGETVDTKNDIFINDSARIAYKFQIDEAVRENDYFKITIPKGIMKLNRSVIKPLMNGSEQIGTIELKSSDGPRGESTIKVTFSVSGQSVTDGYLAAGGTFNERKEDVTYPINHDGSVTSTIRVLPRPKNDSDFFSPGKSPKQPWQPTMNKVGRYNYDDNWFVYALVVNGDERSKLFKQNITGREMVKPRKNIYIYDELPEGMTFNTDRRIVEGGVSKKVDTFRFIMNYDVPAYENDVITEDDMSNTLGATVTIPFEIPDEGNASTILVPKTGKVLFTLDKTNQNLTWEKFQEYIRSKNDRRVGIWHEKKMIINVGGLPAEGLYYEDFYADGATGFKRALSKALAENKISKEQKDRMEKAYIGQEVISFLFDYRTFVNGDMEDVYTNKAYFNYNENKVYPKKEVVKIDWVKGSAKLVKFNANLKVKKVWIGREGGDVNIALKAANDDTINRPATLTKTGAEPWAHTFSGLEEYKGGGTSEKIVYRVEETVPNGYRSIIKRTEEGFTITNIETMNFTVKKEWKNHQGSAISPNLPIKLALFKEGSLIPLQDNVILDAGKASYTFENLDKYELDRTEIKYYVREMEVPSGYEVGYTESTSEPNAFVITNTKKDPTLAKREIEVSKTWKNHEGKIVNNLSSGLPEVKIYLKKNGVRQDDNFLILNSKNNWTSKFTNLSIFDDAGQAISYSVDEEALSNYEMPIYQGNMDDGFEVINKLKSKEVKVTKVWKDVDDIKVLDGPKLPKIHLKLKEEGKDVTITEKILSFFTEGWEYIFKGLPADKTYTIEEKKVNGYENRTEAVQAGKDSHFIITNKREKREDISVKKVWKKIDGITDLESAEAAALPDSIEVSLYANGKEIDTLTLKKAENWMGSFKNLPKYEVDGKTVISYLVEEKTKTPGYIPKKQYVEVYEGVNEVELVNLKEDLTVKTIMVTKEWKDDKGERINDADLLKNLRATFALLKRLDSTSEYEKIPGKTITISGNGSESFLSLPKMEGVKQIEYSVEETETAPGFDLDRNPSVSGLTYSFINKQKEVPKKEITVNKTWFKMDGSKFTALEDDELPAVVMELFDKKDMDRVLARRTLNKENAWRGSFGEFNKIRLDGSTISYVIKELPLSGYVADKDTVELALDETEAGFVNRTEKEEVLVEKVWKKDDSTLYTGEEKKSLPEVELRLYEESAKDTTLRTVKLNNDNGWKHSFENLPKYDISGKKKYVYKVEETAVDGFYKPVYDETNPLKRLVINRKKPFIPLIDDVIVIEPKKPDTPEKPKDEEVTPEKPKPNTDETMPNPVLPSLELPSPSVDIPSLIPYLPIVVTEDEPITPILPDEPISEIEEDEIPLAPPVPPVTPILEEEIPELLLDEDGVPLGDTEIEAEKEKKKKERDSKPKKERHKKLLAQSGGLMNRFIPAVIALGFLILLYFAIRKFFEKKE